MSPVAVPLHRPGLPPPALPGPGRGAPRAPPRLLLPANEIRAAPWKDEQDANDEDADSAEHLGLRAQLLAGAWVCNTPGTNSL